MNAGTILIFFPLLFSPVCVLKKKKQNIVWFYCFLFFFFNIVLYLLSSQHREGFPCSHRLPWILGMARCHSAPGWRAPRLLADTQSRV